MTNFRKFAASSVIAAMLATSATPAFAIPNISKAAATGYDGSVLEEASEYRRWRHRRRRNRVDAGDIIAGIGILAGIAIIADAASKSNKRDRDRRAERNDYPAERYPDQAPPPASNGNDIGSAVSTCSTAAERSAGEGTRVNEVRSATRDGDGWRVSGDLSDNRSFDCGVSNGNVDFIQLS